MSLFGVVLWVLVALAGTAIIWYGTGLLEGSSERLSAYYELPEIVRGTMIVAIGSSFPELTTVVLSTVLHGDFELGVSAIVGSAIFNILFIPALAGIYATEPLEFNRRIIYKEAQFYIISIATLLLTFSFAVIFEPVEVAGDKLLGRLTRGVSLIPVALYFVYVFLQYQDAQDFNLENTVEGIKPTLEWGKLLLGLIVILGGVELVVRSAIRFGEFFGTPSFVWGITVVAASTSLPDTMASVRLSASGHPVTSLANVLGSNTFDLLICVPVGVLIAGSTTINFSYAVPLFAVLIASTLLLFGLMRTSMALTVPECWVLLSTYVLFVVWVLLESFEIINVTVMIP